MSALVRATPSPSEAQGATKAVGLGGWRWPALGALQVRDFRLLWLSGFSLFLARGMQLVAVSWLVLDLTGSPSLVGAALFAQGAPIALFSLAAGIGADRLDRRTLLIASQIASSLMTGLLALLILAGMITTWAVFVFAFALGTAMALGQPSRHALVPALVGRERLMNAVVLNNLVLNLSFVIGPALAGGLLGVLDFGGTFLVQAGVLLCGLPLLLMMRAPPLEQSSTARASIVSDLREGLAYIAGSTLIRSLFIIAVFTGIFFSGANQAVLPIFARDVLKVGPTGFGLLGGALGLGMLAGSIFIATRGNVDRKGDALLWWLLAASLIFLVFALSRWYALSLVTMVAWGVGAAFFITLTVTLIQSHTPDRLMGRVMSVQALAYHGTIPLGSLQAGALAEAIGAPATATIGAAVVGLMACAFLFRGRGLRAAR